MKFIELEKITSTNDYLISLAKKNADNETVVIAKEQTNGRGRMGRSFYSPNSTGIYMSLLLRDVSTIYNITPTAAVAVCNVLEKYSINDCQIKWVNDILYNNKKVCGILTECAFLGEKIDYAVVGIGINVSTDIFPEELQSIAGSIFKGKNVNISLLAKEIAQEFFSLYALGGNIEKYRSKCISQNKDIFVISPTQKTPAHSLNITDNYGLMVEYEDGKIEEITSGEISIRDR